jgi:ribosomal protein S18 acetylase RimI-like enzyme
MAGEAIQTLGGVGYTNEYPTGRLWRDAKLYEIGAGTSEIRRMLIGRELFAKPHDTLLPALRPGRADQEPTHMNVTLRTLTANDTEALEQVRQYFRNYAAWLGVDLSYQNFDQEMASLPGAYAAPQGRLFFAEVDGRPAGCVGMRPLPDSDGVCEMKRLYVARRTRPRRRRRAGAGGDQGAKEIGYRKLMIDTLPNMRMAVKLYRELGFTEAPAYYQTPVEGTMFLALDLDNWSEEEVRNENLSHLFDFNRAWARRCRKSTRPTSTAESPAGTGIPVDRLLRLTRAGQPDRRPVAGRGLRAPQRRQPGAAYRPQLPVGDPVRRRCAEGQAHHGRRPLRLRRRRRRAAQDAGRHRRFLAAQRPAGA